WTAADDKLLGNRTDEEISKLIGCTVGAAASRRYQRHIPASPRQRRRHLRFWTERENEFVRTHSKAEAARLLQRSLHAIAARRGILGICQIVRRSWTTAEDALFHTL